MTLVCCNEKNEKRISAIGNAFAFLHAYEV